MDLNYSIDRELNILRTIFKSKLVVINFLLLLLYGAVAIVYLFFVFLKPQPAQNSILTDQFADYSSIQAVSSDSDDNIYLFSTNATNCFDRNMNYLHSYRYNIVGSRGGYAFSIKNDRLHYISSSTLVEIYSREGVLLRTYETNDWGATEGDLTLSTELSNGDTVTYRKILFVDTIVKNGTEVIWKHFCFLAFIRTLAVFSVILIAIRLFLLYVITPT